MRVGSEIKIIDVESGTLAGQFAGLPEGAEFTDENAVYRWQIRYGPGYDITLRLTYIPEPTTLALLGLGTPVLAGRRKRR